MNGSRDRRRPRSKLTGVQRSVLEALRDGCYLSVDWHPRSTGAMLFRADTHRHVSTIRSTSSVFALQDRGFIEKTAEIERRHITLDTVYTITDAGRAAVGDATANSSGIVRDGE